MEFEVHLSLVGFNFHQHITGLETVTGLLLPCTNVSRGHGRRQSRHADDSVRGEGYKIQSYQNWMFKD